MKMGRFRSNLSVNDLLQSHSEKTIKVKMNDKNPSKHKNNKKKPAPNKKNTRDLFEDKLIVKKIAEKTAK